MKQIHSLVFTALVFSASAQEGKVESPPNLDEIVFDAKLWEKSLEDIKGTQKELENGEIPKEIRDKLALDGIEIGSGPSAGFEWLSSKKEGLRARPGVFEFLGEEAGEVVIRAEDGKASTVTISLYNRGDNGVLPLSTFNKQFDGWKSQLDEKLGVESVERNSKGAVAVTGWMWTKGDTATLLESSVNRSEKRPEFIRLRMASISAAKNRSGEVAKRSSLEDNVKKDEDGFTVIDGIPMVDQGEKGYCVVASIERVGRYYGLEMDQHEMAQLADTTEDGTRGDVMEKAFQKITGRIHVRTLKLIEFDDRQFERDVRSYNRAAKKAEKWTFDVDLDEWIVHPAMFWSKADTDIFREIKAKQNRYDHFNRKIKEYVDQGVPLCWTLFLGMYKEGDMPQSWGGHMRLIIGYNFEDPEVPMIYYTDSWGEGHSLKKMRADEAYCMTTALYAMVPNK
ncbi:hypothetical protein ACFQY0_05615 [Haloferula chungangensis]|uniref:Peptidase C39-like domain-containing protein n=1 Tax=Haloferula chungangensis TaxID=1048331 RepID=A0ABW2L671_9BACT